MSYAHDHAVIATRFGALRIEGDDERLTRITFDFDALPIVGRSAAIREAVRQLDHYFAGTLQHFELPLALPTTSRGQALRQGIIDIAYGETLSYGALARILGSGARAIGQACARNPFPIVVPCHRVLGAGSLGHYTGGYGLETKQALLTHEAAARP